MSKNLTDPEGQRFWQSRFGASDPVSLLAFAECLREHFRDLQDIDWTKRLIYQAMEIQGGDVLTVANFNLFLVWHHLCIVFLLGPFKNIRPPREPQTSQNLMF